MENLIVYKCPFPKVRLGKPNDGGYVIADVSQNYDLFISGGISNDISFEDALLDRFPNLQCLAFDGTIQSLPGNARHSQRMTFIKKNLGCFRSEEVSNLEEEMAGYENIFMKIDIEGHEFSLLPAILANGQMNKIAQLVLEVHTPGDMRLHPDYYSKLTQYNTNKTLFDLLGQLKLTHTIVHFHANNGCKQHDIASVRIPNVFEITLVRNDILEGVGYKWPVNNEIIPAGIDMPNIPYYPEIMIDYPPFCFLSS